MKKSQKMVNKIKHSIYCGQRTRVGQKPNDECYTPMQDILDEMSYWASLDKFRGKNIICPCDWDVVDNESVFSIHITYNDTGVSIVANDVAQIAHKYDLWNDDSNIINITLAEDELDDFFKDKLTCNFVRTFTQNARAWGIKSITASGYNPVAGKGVPFQNVDYSKYDLCCTNPPFSIYGEFMKCIVDKIDFICLAPFLNRASPCVGLPLMLGKAYFGNGAGIGPHFYNPTSKNPDKTKQVVCDWITSFPEAQNERNESFAKNCSGISYEAYKDEFLVMENMTMKDGTHPIRVPGVNPPDDYDGWMFTSINFLHHHDLRKYEWYGTNFSGYYNTTNPAANPFQHKVDQQAMMNAGDKNMFAGIVFRKKPQ